MKAGIICDFSFKRHICFKNYYYALKKYFPQIKVVQNFLDVKDLDILFIGNEHFGPHKEVWMDENFIKFCNKHEVKVVSFSAEKIFNSYFKHNENIQANLEKFKFLYQYPCDVEDCKILNRPLLRSCISRHYERDVVQNKEDKCLFIGSTSCFSYQERRNLLEKIKSMYEVDIMENIEEWSDYIKMIGKYRFVLSPLGNALCFNLRFYEILTAKSIPVQQVKAGMMDLYTRESEFEDCIFFENAEECVEKMLNSTIQNSYNNIWLEDHIRDLLLNDNILIG